MNVAATDEKAPTRDPARAANATMTGPSSVMIALMPPKRSDLRFDHLKTATTTMQFPFQLFLRVDGGQHSPQRDRSDVLGLQLKTGMQVAPDETGTGCGTA